MCNKTVSIKKIMKNLSNNLNLLLNSNSAYNFVKNYTNAYEKILQKVQEYQKLENNHCVQDQSFYNTYINEEIKLIGKNYKQTCKK